MIIHVITSRSTSSYLVKVESETHVDEIKKFLKISERVKAMESVLTKGRLLKEFDRTEGHLSSEADLTITDGGAYWNLV